jgi:hypothetical protein
MAWPELVPKELNLFSIHELGGERQPPKGFAIFNKTAVLAWRFPSESETQQGSKFVYGWASTGRGQDIVYAEWLVAKETAPMSFKENVRVKIKLDRLLHKLVSTIREPPRENDGWTRPSPGNFSR